MYDLIIVGGGPAGVAAGVYAARKKIKTLLIAKEFGGQSLASADIQNWIGAKSISGFDLAKNLEEHLRAQEEIEILDGDFVAKVEKSKGKSFKAVTESGKNFEAKTVLVCSGSHHKKLGVPGEDKLNGRGVVYCSTCDAPLFGGKTVAVVGAGNAGLEAVRDLFAYADKIYLLVRGDAMKGDPVTLEEIKANPKLEIKYQVEVREILGEQLVTGVRYLDKAKNQTEELKLDGVFVEIGSAPNSDLVKDLVELDERGQIIVDHKTQMTSFSGIWAAGDVSDVLYKQNNISAGDAVKAVLNIYDHLNKNK
ncbi:MAG: FAD-dependent oxidoreductase [Candidatus Harrisonbacteria bacterium]|nr:FAD-dependent oxidoreductase [Candidatus Harrisonbacteria bacterium]